MKTLATLLFAATTAIAINANADPLMDIIHPESADIFQLDENVIVPQAVVKVSDNGKEVWSVEYEQWVNPADFNVNYVQSIALANERLRTNPPAAGKPTAQVFIWDEAADEFQLQ